MWKPGEAVPAEPLGTGVAMVDVPRRETTPPTPRTPTPAPAPRRPSVPRPPAYGGGVLAERPPWLVPAAVAVVIVLLLGIVGFVVFSHRNAGTTGQVHNPPTPHATTSPHGSPSSSPTGGQPQAVPNYGATSADPVKSVQICTVPSPCDIPGSTPETATACDVSSCKVEVAIYFTAVQKSVKTSYIIKFFDRCTGQTTDLPGPSATTPASGYIVEIPTDHWPVNIPNGVKSGAIVAVTQTPAVAASAPLLIGGTTC